jgi:anti-anti-sigma factor
VVQAGRELTIYQVEKLRQKLIKILPRIRRLKLDLSRVMELDSAGIQLLLALQRECGRTGLDFQISASSAPVQAALAVYQLDRSLTPPVTTSTAQAEHEAARP